jgi:glycosyltransferase involved in cell wall biosynthesis
MKILLAVHGYPPELAGGTELSVQALARGLAGGGHTVTVVAGSITPSSVAGAVERVEHDDAGPEGARIRVIELRRSDLYFDHWHKSLSPDVAREFRRVVREAQPDVVHVHHWIRLSRDLVANAAREGVPALVTLHDAWTSCPIAFRVRPDTRESCEVPVGPHPCIACAAKVPPRTPWVATEAAFMMLAERQRDLAREIDLARALVAPSAAHARSLARFLGRGPAELAVQVIPPLCAERYDARRAIAPPPVHGSLVLVALGALSEHKGTDLLLDALRRLRSKTPVELRLIGAEGPRRDGSSWRSAAEGLRVQFLGTRAPSELRTDPALDAHALVSATRASESYGLVLDEARLLGLPAILPRLPAFEERSPGGDGVAWFEIGDAAGLARAIEQLADDEALLAQLRAQSLRLRDTVPTSSDVLRAHEALYAEAIARGAPVVAPEGWFEARMASEALAAWDRALATRSSAELGFAPKSGAPERAR